MSRFLLIGLIAIGIAAPLAIEGPAQAGTSQYACSYVAKLPAVAGRVTFSLVTPANVGPAFCVSFNSTFGGRPLREGENPGLMLALWHSNTLHVDVAVRATRPVFGRVFVKMLAPKMAKLGFARIA